MAIIKNGRINIWNAVKKKFETVHPETETARITDFAEGIVHKLALTSAMTAVTALQKDSWFGNLLKMALTASGVKYNIAQNGYICFGDLFGGLIIQWIYADITSSANTIRYPITMSSTLTAIAVDVEPVPSLVKPIGISTWSGSTLTVAPVDYHAITIWVIGV